MAIRNRYQAVELFAQRCLRRLATVQLRRRTAKHVVALITAPMLLSGVAVVAQAPATPVGASWCGIFTGWNLEYHDKRAFSLVAQGYDNSGNSMTAHISTPGADTKDSTHCWADNAYVYFTWYDYYGNYLSQTSKRLPSRCGGTFPFNWCYVNWSPIAQIYGP
jgi:hypothetical protein